MPCVCLPLAQTSRWGIVRDKFEESKTDAARRGFRVALLQEKMLHKVQLQKIEQVTLP